MQPDLRDFTALLALRQGGMLTRDELPHAPALSRLFRQTGRYAKAMRCPCGCGGIADVEECNDRLTACALCPEGGIYDVPLDGLELFSLDEVLLRSLVSREFGCSGGSGVNRGGDLFDLGTMDESLDSVRRKVYFCLHLDSAAMSALPADRSSLLVVGSEYHALPDGKFDGRILDFSEVFCLDGDDIRLDRELLSGRFGGGLSSTKKPEKVGTRKETVQTRIANIKRLIKAHLKSAFDAYWHENNDGDSAITLLPRPSLENICAMLKAQFKEKKTLNVSTVHRTIQAALNQKGSYYDAEFKTLWEGCLDENFVRRYASKMR